MSEEQMEKFRMLLSSDIGNDTQAPNFRPVMPLNDRIIYQCKEDIEDDALFTDDTEKDEYMKQVDEDSISVEETANKCPWVSGDGRCTELPL